MFVDRGSREGEGCSDLMAGRRAMGDQIANEAASRPVHQDVRHGDHNQVTRESLVARCRRVYSKTIRSSTYGWKDEAPHIACGVGQGNTGQQLVTR